MQGLSPVPPRQQSPVNIDPDVPCYLIIEKRGFVDDQDRLWPKGSRLYWEGEPCMAFDPLNDIAEVAMLEYLEKQDKLARDVADQKGSAHASLVNAFEARRRIKDLQKRQRGDSPDDEEEISILGVKRPRKGMAKSIEEGAPKASMLGQKKTSSRAKAEAQG